MGRDEQQSRTLVLKVTFIVLASAVPALKTSLIFMATFLYLDFYVRQLLSGLENCKLILLLFYDNLHIYCICFFFDGRHHDVLGIY